MSHLIDKRIKDALSKNHACYLLITCDAPNTDGEMQVEMSYEGLDAQTASFLLQGAQSYIDDQEADELDQMYSEKIHPLLD